MSSDVRIAYDVGGGGEPPIVFLHGWSCDRSFFAPQFQHFSAGHTVATIDLRGHGESDRPKPDHGAYEVDAFAADVLAVAKAEGFDRPVVVGHSLGGLIALACGGRPEAVRAAVMVDPAPIVNGPVKAFLGEAADLVEADDDASWRTNFANGWFLPSDTVRREDILRGMSALPPKVAAASVRAIAHFDGITALRGVKVPLLSIGSAAPTDAPSDLRSACATITIGQTVGSGHFNQLEVPEQVNLMIDKFLEINSV